MLLSMPVAPYPDTTHISAIGASKSHGVLYVIKLSTTIWTAAHIAQYKIYSAFCAYCLSPSRIAATARARPAKNRIVIGSSPNHTPSDFEIASSFA